MKVIGYETTDESIAKRGRVTYIIDDDLPEDAPALAILGGHGYTAVQIEGIVKILWPWMNCRLPPGSVWDDLTATIERSHE